MELIDKINPQEVLLHLHQLGYQNISPHQLKEFIQDLKKLIVHDQLSSSSGSLSSLSTSISSTLSSDSEYYSSNETMSSTESGSLGNRCENIISYPIPQKKIYKDENACPRSQAISKTSSVSSRSKMRRSTMSMTSISQKCIQKENLPLCRGRTKSTSEENIQEAIKPKTSFIRPWQLQGMTSGSSRPAPSDPVKMYHHYQTLWAKHKYPGEDSHADLRWMIREKMIGQDPHLYSKVAPPKKTWSRV